MILISCISDSSLVENDLTIIVIQLRVYFKEEILYKEKKEIQESSNYWI